MGGAMLQLVAYGAQDVYLTGTPQITFFRSIYKRYSHFASEFYKNLVTESITNGSTLRIKLARVGDLVGEMFFELPVLASALRNVTADGSTADIVYLAERAFASIELQIGNNTIDKHYQGWWRVYAELFMPSSKQSMYNKLVTNAAPKTTSNQTCFLPLLFFFNRNPGLFLPLCALQYHDVTLICTLASNYSTYFDTSIKPILWTNYITLDKDERKRFTQSPHEYLIEQVQTSVDTVPSQKLRVQFRHPVKELIWCYPIVSTNPNQLWNFTTNTSVQITLGSSTSINSTLTPTLYNNTKWVEDGPTTSDWAVGPLDNITLFMNGQERFQHTGKFLNQVQPYTYHSGSPYPGIYVYSFALKPEDAQPSGTCNFSRIDSTEFSINLKSGATNPNQEMYAVNYNVLRIQSGLGGLAFV